MLGRTISWVLSDNANGLLNHIKRNKINIGSIIDLQSDEIHEAVSNRLLPPRVIEVLEYRSQHWYLINIATIYGRIESVRTLLKLDSSIAKKANISLAIEFSANNTDSISIIQELLESGADPNGTESNILHLLYSQEMLNIKCMDDIRHMVLKFGADPNRENSIGQKPHDNLLPHNAEEAKYIITLIQHGATYSEESTNQLLESQTGIEILAHLDCSIIHTKCIAERVREIMKGYQLAKVFNWNNSQFPSQFEWEKKRLLELKRQLMYKINTMHSGEVPSRRKIREYMLIHLPRFIKTIHHVATWIKLCERRIDGDENVELKNIITSINIMPMKVKSLKLMCLQQLHCNKLFGPVSLYSPNVENKKRYGNNFTGCMHESTLVK